MHRTAPALAAAAMAAAATVSSAQIGPRTADASGVVFHDRNRDGVRQTGEPGLGGVAVSNGQAVVVTDAAGRYSIPIDAEDGRVFVIKPRGYQVELDGLNLPRGYYLHKPEGSPDDGFIFEGVDATGPLPDSIDFGLTSVAEPERFTVIAYGDPQAYTLQQLDLFRSEVVDPIIDANGNTAGAAFGLSLGDLVGDLLTLFEPLNEAQALFGVPWYNVYGNHDMNFLSGSSSITRADPDRYADETYERVYGPTDFAFQYGRVHFIVLDNVIHEGFEGFRDEPNELWPGGRVPVTSTYRGGLREHQLSLIDSYLDVVPADDLVVLAFHIPMQMDGEGVHRIPEARELFRILSSHPNTFSLSGHTHLQRHWFFGAESGYTPEGTNQHTERDPQRFPRPVHHHLNMVTSSGSWYNGFRDETGMPHATMSCGAPNGYTLLHFDGPRYETEFRAARREASHQMSIYIDTPPVDDGRISTGRNSGTVGPRGAEIVVNVFNGAEGDDVRMRIVPGVIDGARPAPTEWMPLAFTPRVDPLYEAAWEREQAIPDSLKSSWGLPRPRESHHIWSGTLPASLPAGTHAVEIRHIDLYGRERTGRQTFRVE